MKKLIPIFLLLSACASDDATRTALQIQEDNFKTCMTLVTSQPQKYCGIDVYSFMTGFVFARHTLPNQSQAVESTGTYKGCEFVISGVIAVNSTCALSIANSKAEEIIFQPAGPTTTLQPGPITIGGQLVIGQ